MNMIRRKPPVKSGIERGIRRAYRSHRQWVKTRACIIEGCAERLIDPAHFDGPVPWEERGGKSQKDHDKWCFPCCRVHHSEIHNKGWKTFEKKYGVDLKKAAEECARLSPHRHKWEILEKSA